jgi:formate/nitrite transporter
MDYVKPTEAIASALQAAQDKAALSVQDLLIRGALAGAFLGFATSLVIVVLAQGVAPIVGAALFPVGFVMLVLLGLELATGNFALLPQALAAGRISVAAIGRNWAWVLLGNLLGSLCYAVLFYLATTNFGTDEGGAIGEQLRQIAERKTLLYRDLGLSGWATAFVKGVLCNWMVTLGALLAFTSRSTAGKVVAMWLPIMTFFAQGFEHSIVNMFVIPIGMLFGAPVGVGDWWVWNQVPVTLGNIVSGALLTGLALYVTHRPARQSAPQPLANAVEAEPVAVRATS